MFRFLQFVPGTNIKKRETLLEFKNKKEKNHDGLERKSSITLQDLVPIPLINDSTHKKS